MKYNGFENEYHSGSICIYQGNCMGLLKQTPDKYYSLAIIDPPYGIGEDGAKNHSREKLATPGKYNPYSSGDKEPPPKEYFDELIRISKNQIIWGANHFISRIPYDSPCWIVWDKDNSGDFADCELAWTSFTSAVRKFRWRWNGMLQQNMKNKQERIHPNEKPIELYKWLLQNYAKEGDTILDTHFGSLSIGIACHDLKFDLTAIELDKDYYEQAKKRLEFHQRQLQLF
jgi:site-specific DNA-methyltransferase (adenine-specific)